ncbi:MAG: alpha/beta hydrolase-fold protein [Candidatus Sericytochromatia bacterium]|nr:alpha/beta hydrolase-fold protein [Candidatus Sericytochromatia bacterium]
MTPPRKLRSPAPPGTLRPGPRFRIPGLPAELPATLYTPPGYGRVDRQWPLAILFDGQNLFEDHGTFAGGWHLHRVLDRRAQRGLVVPVVLALHHGGASRVQELAPWPVEPEEPAHGLVLADWIAADLATWARQNLQVSQDREDWLIGGSSMGGLAALVTFFRHNDRFARLLCMSPSLWVADGEAFPFVAKAPAWGQPRIWLDCGGREAGGYPLQHAEWMAQLLRRKGFVEGRDLTWHPVRTGSHDERSWRRRLPAAMRFLYGDPVRKRR